MTERGSKIIIEGRPEVGFTQEIGIKGGRSVSIEKYEMLLPSYLEEALILAASARNKNRQNRTTT